jgi:hypothetical protein
VRPMRVSYAGPAPNPHQAPPNATWAARAPRSGIRRRAFGPVPAGSRTWPGIDPRKNLSVASITSSRRLCMPNPSLVTVRKGTGSGSHVPPFGDGRQVGDRPYSARFQRLAGHKIQELDRLIERARTVQTMLRSALRCRC